jgi:hypothetical protein
VVGRRFADVLARACAGQSIRRTVSPEPGNECGDATQRYLRMSAPERFAQDVRVSELNAKVVSRQMHCCGVVVADDVWPLLDPAGVEVVVERAGELLLDASLAGEHRGRASECLLRYGVTFGPTLPSGEGADAEPAFADVGHHRVEQVDGFAVAQLLVRIALNDSSLGVSFDGGRGPLARPVEVMLGSFELLLADVDVLADGPPTPAWRIVEPMLCRAMTPSCFHCPSLGQVEGVSVGGGRGGNLGEVGVCARGCGSGLSTPRRLLRLAGFGVS